MTMPRDTSREAFAVQIERLREAGPEARANMAAELSDVIRELTLAGIRDRHPDFDDRDVYAAFVHALIPIVAPPAPER